MSLLNFPRHSAVFVDSNGDYVGKKVIGRSFGALGQKEKTFDYDGGTYNFIPEKTSRLNFNFSNRLIFDDYIFVYQLYNPNPISFKGGHFTPVMDSKSYKSRLTNKLVIDLNKIAQGGFKINWKYVLIGLVVLAVAYYFLSGGTLLGGAEAVENATSSLTP
eukprot:GHVR01183971.1.p1 GENE.GHVR01183971.1~~GHVR01183971.1.p1  ORF type:complete len:161 (-),score=8.72 GHVR01183971.1:46-528(-)